MDIAKLRWRIERDYLDLKQEIGIGHYEGRGWRGFHHHATLCIAAYAFLVLERETIPPSQSYRAGNREKAAVPAGYKPRGHAGQGGEAYPKLHRHGETEVGRRASAKSAEMPLLRNSVAKDGVSSTLVTQ